MRRVVNTDGVAHLWAHQTQPEARNARGNFYFEGTTIWSYGSHFPIAQHVTNADSAPCVWITVDDYSFTTRRQEGLVRRAIPSHLPVFNVKLDRHTIHMQRHQQIAAFLDNYSNRIGQEIETTSKSRVPHTKEYRFLHLVLLINEANRFAEFFGVQQRFQVPAEFDDLKGHLERIREDDRRRAKELSERLAKENADAVREWISGGTRPFPFQVHDIYLRVEGEEIVSSQGARFPIEHARKAMPMVRRVWQSGAPYQRGDHSVHLGVYVVDAIETDGTIRAGCHVVPRAEVERIAALIGA